MQSQVAQQEAMAGYQARSNKIRIETLSNFFCVFFIFVIKLDPTK